MPSNALERYEVIRRRPPDAAGSHASVAVAKEDPAILIDSDLIKVEQVAIGLGAALLPDAGVALDGIVRSSVYCYPGLALVVSGSDEGIPFTRKT